MKPSTLFVLGLLCLVSLAEVYLKENFPENFSWTQSTTKSDYGTFVRRRGDYYGAEDDYGIATSQDARHYAFSTSFKEFSNTGKSLVIQYTVKHEQGIDCGGSYLKLGSTKDLEKLTDFKDDTKYHIMFGPDICGATKKVHFIFHYKGKNLDWKKTLRCEDDKLSHIYTAIVHPDNTYEVQIDGVKKESGSLEEDWDFLPPKKIDDPNDKKPADWVDDAKIPDPTDKKPEDWDKEPKFIPDEKAKQPEDWDEEEDGKWEPPQISNPKYKGEWKPKMIDNPDYKGIWAPKKIDNPDYKPDDKLYEVSLGWVGIEVWQVKSGTIFKNILITDSVEEAKSEVDRLKKIHAEEKRKHDEEEAKKRQKEEEERKKREEEEKKKKEEEEKKKEAEKKPEGEKKDHDEL